MMGFEAHVASHIQEGSKPLNPILNSIHGARTSQRAPPPPDRVQRSRVGFDSLDFFGWFGSTSVGPLAHDVPPSSVPSAGGGGFYGSPTLGTARDSVRVPTIARLLSCKFHAPDSLSAA